MDYKATLNLPKTAFPMKANLPESEPKMLAWWEQFGIYKRLRQGAAAGRVWILPAGPRYGNGNIHLGHVLNKVLKDVVVKSRAMLGFNAVFVPGWDCHGLPIEHQVDKELGLDDPSVDIRRAMDPVEKRRKCREYALRFIDIQRNEFKRLGVLGDWDNPYVTMAPAYQAIIAREFGRFVGRGLVHKGLKPVHWCMHCKTALAQAEVEYEEQRTPSVWVKFPLTSVPAELQAKLAGRRAFAVVWTTTPWTLPANLAIAVHPTQSYEALALSGEVYLVARARGTEFLSLFPAPKYDVVGFFEGHSLVGHTFRHPWIDREGTIAAADFVGMDQGTGLVHIAPGHGEEDYELGRSLGLPIFNPVDDDGRFVPGVERFAGLTVWEANPKIIDYLRSIGMLIAERTLDHTYPHCWRCKNPTIFRATEQWFIELDKQEFRARARGDQARRAVDPAVGRGADLQHGGAPPRVGHLTAEGLGGADRRVLLRGVWHAAPRGADRRPRRADLPRRPRCRRVVRARGPRASSPRHALRQVRRRPVREGDRHPRRLVRLGVQPRGRPRDAARAPVAGGDVHRGLGPAPRVVPVLAPRVGRHARRATL